MNQLTAKPCKEMSDSELSEFIEQGAWRKDSNGPDSSAYREVLKRFRKHIALCKTIS